jgi:hypothetical protein
MKTWLLLIFLPLITFLPGCTGSMLEGQWIFIGVTDPQKMARDFSDILSKITPRTVDYMKTTGMIDTSDSLNVFSCADTPKIAFSIKPFIFSRGRREFTGSLGCKNRFKSRFLSGSGKLFLKEIAMTTLPCNKCDRSFLFMYRQYLFALNRYQVNGDTLVLRTLFSNDLLFRKDR